MSKKVKIVVFLSIVTNFSLKKRKNPSHLNFNEEQKVFWLRTLETSPTAFWFLFYFWWKFFQSIDHHTKTNKKKLMKKKGDNWGTKHKPSTESQERTRHRAVSLSAILENITGFTFTFLHEVVNFISKQFKGNY